MRSYVVDANAIFSAVISGREIYIQAFAANTFYVPDFTLDEIQQYQLLLLNKTKLAPEALRVFTLRLFSNLIVVPNFLISTASYVEAFRYCKDIDEKDTAYVALSIEFDIELVSKDEVLVAGLRKKGYKKILSLQEFLEGIEKA